MPRLLPSRATPAACWWWIAWAPQAGTPLEHGGTVEHRIFRDIIDYIEPGDVLVINKTRVMPARLIGRKTGSGGVVETLLLKRREDASARPCLGVPGQAG